MRICRGKHLSTSVAGNIYQRLLYQDNRMADMRESASSSPASNLRVALRPLADDIDDDVLCFLFEELANSTTETSSFSIIDDTLKTFSPLFADQPPDRRRAIVQRTQMLFKRGLSESTLTAAVEKSSSFKKNVSISMVVDKVDDDERSKTLSEFDVLLLSIKPSDVTQLQALFPDVHEEHLRYAIASTGGASSCIEKAASFLLENDIETLINEIKKDINQRHNAESALAKANRVKEDQAKAAALARYDEQVDDKDKRYRPTLPPEMLVTLPKGAKVVKYLDGKPIYLKPSEKFIIEKDEREELLTTPQTTLKIKKKGQGGASPGFKK